MRESHDEEEDLSRYRARDLTGQEIGKEGSTCTSIDWWIDLLETGRLCECLHV